MNERINYFIQSIGISVSEFERVCDLSNGAVSKMGDNTRTSTLDKISKAFPSLSIAWLRTGEGEMLKGGISQTTHGDNSPNINGSGNHLEPASALLGKALDEISEMRKALTEALAVNQQHTERLISIIEDLNKQNNKLNS